MVYCFTCYGILLPTIYISTDHRDRYLSMVHITDVTSRETFTSIFTIKMENEKELVGAAQQWLVFIKIIPLN